MNQSFECFVEVGHPRIAEYHYYLNHFWFIPCLHFLHGPVESFSNIVMTGVPQLEFAAWLARCWGRRAETLCFRGLGLAEEVCSMGEVGKKSGSQDGNNGTSPKDAMYTKDIAI